MRRYKIADNIVYRPEDNGLVILKIETGEPYFIENSAKDIWNIIVEKGEATIEDIINTLSKDWDVGQEQKKDIEEFLNKCLEERLINVF